MLEIQSYTKLFDILKNYPDLEEKIMDIAPPFKNLKNPVLRRTVGKLATIEKVAKIGNLEVLDLVNRLRSEVGQDLLNSAEETESIWEEGQPEWLKGKAVETIDGTEMLSRGEHPLSKVNSMMKKLKPNEFIELRTNFKPLPLIDEMEKQNYEVYSKALNEKNTEFVTFFRKT